jgi:polysaccharide pyruvyl transferase WcaK-like protein
MKKILALFAYADYNKGDSAICLGADKLLKRLYPDAEVHFAHFLEEGHAYTRQAEQFYQDNGIRTIHIPNRKKSKSTKLTSLFGFTNNAFKDFYNEQNFDLVVSVGGHFLFSKDESLEMKVRNKLRLLEIYEPIIEAKKQKIKTGILCQSIGPFNKKDRVIDSIFSSLDFIITRESNSLKDVNEKYNNALGAIDLAYYMNISLSEVNPVRAVVDSDYVVLNMRKVLASGGYEVSDELYEKQFSYFKEITNEFLNKGLKVLLLSQVGSYDSGNAEVDTKIHTDFKGLYFKNNSNVILDNKIYSESELLRIYKDARGLVSTRYHGLIFCIIAGGNPIGVNIEGIGHKLTGMFADLKLNEQVILLNEQDIRLASDITTSAIEKPKKYDAIHYVESNFIKMKNYLS